MQNYRPKIILEGSHIANTRAIALKLNDHPEIVGSGGDKIFSVVISADWCSFTKFPWGEHLIDFKPEDQEQAMGNYRTWMRLIEVQKHQGWIIDRFHLSTRAFQLKHHQTQIDFGWLEERLDVLNFQQFLITLDPELVNRTVNNGRKTPGEDIDSIIEEQNLLRQMASASILPTKELVVKEIDIQNITNRIIDWVEASGANYFPEGNYSTGRIITTVC